MLENEIMVNRAYTFTCTANAVQTISSDASDVTASGELKVSWPKQALRMNTTWNGRLSTRRQMLTI